MPLSRFKVLDITRVRAGPTAVRQLADWGADVIKIEAPAALDKAQGMGGARHGPDFQNLHRNKRNMTLNLKSPAGRDVFMRMVRQADVVVENFRPDVKARLKVDYPACREANPRIVYASVSGFGQSGPYRMRPGFDQIAQGMGGLMRITGMPGQGPMRVGVPIADLASGLYAALGIMVALLEREESGEGRWVHTSLLEAQIAMLDFQAARWIIAGEVPPQAGNDHPTSIPTGVFDTADGCINIAASGDEMWRRLCTVFEDEALSKDPLYASGQARSDNRKSLNRKITEHLSKAGSAKWIERLNEAGIPCGPIYHIDEMWADAQVEHLAMKTPTQHPILGEVNVVRNPVNIEGLPAADYSHTAERGEHTAEILGEFGLTDDEIKGLEAEGVL
ncbi:MAG: CoA transferase [Ectothiorhodospiraceae bacterium AqS1]|nr:CoA transferase [Ectothiorhodospiraceae bacterium AqS1]